MEQGYIHIANNIFPTLLAISAEEQAKGLMFQEWPPPIMSFIYRQAQVNRFWMHNTKSPLDIIFCHQGQVSQICQGEPYSTAIIGDNKPSDLIVEFPLGTAKTFNLKLGHSVGIVKPSAAELKKIIAAKY